MSAGGAGFFRAGSIGMIVVGLMHLVGHVTAHPPADAPVVAAMQGFTATAWGMTWSVHDAYQALSLSYTASSLWVGVVGLVLLRALRPQAGALRALAVVFAAGAATLAALTLAYHVAPPTYCYALVSVLFGVGAARAR